MNIVATFLHWPHPRYLPGQIMAGMPFTYTVTLANNGTNTVSNVALTNTLPGGATILSGSASLGTATVSNGVLLWNITGLTNGVTAILTVTAMPTTDGSYANQIVFTGGSGWSFLRAV